MPDLLGTLRNIGVLGVPRVPDAKSDAYAVTSGVPAVFQVHSEHPKHQQEHQPYYVKALDNKEEPREHREHFVNFAPGLDCAEEWINRLDRLDAATPPSGFTPDRWRELLDDARWLAGRHGSSASSLGWTSSDMFGLDDQLDCWGGLADRLVGGRCVELTEALAWWQSSAEVGWLWRRTLQPMRLLWDVPMKP